MAMENQVNVNINVTDNGTTNRLNSAAQRLRETYESAGAAAAGVARGTAGSRAVSAGAMPSGTGAGGGGSGGGGGGGITSNEVRSYGVMRGTAAATGSSARDFARQSEGLGGLVRIYATAAANIYALASAFNVLSKAADTTNMIQGLNQLGAASGVALGNVAKNIVKATDGAVSLREAMEVAVKSSAAGMMSKDIMEMTSLAQKASIALGVNLSDALSRVQRGIIKLEPELLDELGVFTKLEPAYEAYAKNLNITASSLTNVQKQEAYRIAVLKELRDKFGEINGEANAYDKLLASLKDLTSAALQFLNLGLLPIVKVLSSNPVILTGLIVSLGTAIAKKTLPQLLELKKGIENVSLAASAKAAEKRGDLLTNLLPSVTEVKSRAEKIIAAYSDGFETAQRSIQSRLKNQGSGADARLVGIAAKSPKDITKDELEYVKALELRSATASKAQKDLENLRKNAEGIQSQGKVQIAAEREINKLVNERGNMFTIAGKIQRDAMDEMQKATSKNIINQAALTASTQGLGVAWGQLWKNLKDARKDSNIEETLKGTTKAGVDFEQKINTIVPALGAFRLAGTAVGGMLASLIPYITLLGSALLKAVPIVGALITAFELLKTFFGGADASRTLDAFNSSLEETIGAAENLERTFKRFEKVPFLEQFNTQNMQAKANSLTTISDAMQTLVEKTAKADKAANGFDRIWDSLKKFVGADLRTQVTKGLTTSFESAFKSLDPDKSGKLKQKVADILKIDVKDIDNADKFSAAISRVAQDEPKMKLLGASLVGISTAASDAAAKAAALDGALTKSSDSFKKFTDAYRINDPLVQFGLDSLSALDELSTVLQGDLEPAFKSVEKTVSQLARNPIFGSEGSVALSAQLPEIRSINDEYKKQEDRLKQIGQEFADIKDKKISVDAARLSTLQTEETKIKSNIDGLRSRMQTVVSIVQKAIPGAVESQATVIASRIGSAMQKAANLVTNDIASRYKDVPEMVALEAENRKKQLAKDGEMLRITQMHIATVARNTIAVEKSTAAQKVTDAREAYFKADVKAEKAKNTPEYLPLLEEAAKLAVKWREANTALEQLGAASVAMEEVFKNPGQFIAKYAGGKNPFAFATPGEDNKPKTVAIVAPGLAKLLLETAAQSMGVAAQLKSLEEEGKLVDLTKERAMVDARIQRDKLQPIKEQKELKDLELKRLDAQDRAFGYATKITIKKREELELDKAQLDLEERLSILNGEEEKTLMDIAALRAKGEEGRAARLEQQKLPVVARARGMAVESFTEQVDKGALDREQRLRELASQRFAFEQSITEFRNRGADANNRALTAQENISLELLKQYNFVSQTTILSRQKAIADAQAAREESASIKNLETAKAQSIQEANNIVNNADRRARLAAIDESYKAEKKSIEDIAKFEKDARQQKFNLDFETAQSEEKLKNLTSLAEKLNSAFVGVKETWANFATNLGATLKTFGEIGVQSARNAAEIASANKAIAASRKADGGAEDSEATKDLIKDRDKLVRKSQQQEIAGYAQVAGAAKNMFKQKTGAYRAFAAMEKAMHMVSLALKIKEMLFDDVATQKKVANSVTGQAADGAAAGVSGVRAIVDAIKGPFPMNVVMGALTAAMVASLLSSIGQSTPSVSMPSAPTAEEKRATVGTAQSYNSDNQLEQYRPGVLGDASARSEVFTKSLELMNANSVESLAYSYKMVTALLAIKAGINNLAGVFKTARGLSVGSAFGTKEGVTKGGNVFTTRTREVDIERSGIKVSGSIFDLRDNVLSAARAFEEGVVKTSSSTLGFIKRNSSQAFLNEQTLEQALGPVAAKRLSNALNKTFGNAIDLSMQIGNRMGLTDQQIVNMMSSVVIDPLREGLLDLRDVPIADQPAIIEAWAAGIVDKVTAPFLAGFEKYANENAEDLTQIAIRTITQYDNANQMLKQMPGFAGIDKAVGNDLFRGIDISQGLIDTFGGYEQFAESMNEFNSSILTEQEQKANKQKMVQTAMENAGLKDVTTMEKFREVYKKALTDMTSTDQTLAASATQLVHDMVAIGPAFKEVGTQASEMIKKLEDSFKLTKEATKGILLEVFKTAKDAAEAQTLAQEKASKLVYDSIIETATDAISTQLFDVAIKPLMDSVVAASAQAAASTIAGGVTAGTAVAAGGMIAKDALEKAVNQARATITAMSEIMKDPEFKNALQSVTGSIGTFASDMYMTLPGAGSESSSSKFELSKFLEELNKEIDNANKQIRQLGMTSYEKALDDINVKTEAYAKQLRDAAVPSAAATDAIKAFTEAQIALLKAQNEAKATEIIKNLKQQMSDGLLSSFGKELVANTRQAQDYAKQLRDINQLTNDNIRTLNEWENANRERIINTAIEQQNKAYDELFKTSTATAQGAQKLSNKFVALGLQMPKSAAELKTLVDGFKYTTVESIELRGKVIELAQEFNAAFSTLSDAVRSAYDARVQELTGARDEFKQFATSIRDFKQSLLLSAESPLSPLEKYTKAQAEYIKVRDLAESGDKVAMGKLESVSQAFLEQSRGMFAGTESYVRDFNDVIKALDNTESAAEIQMHAAIDSLAGIRETVSSLIRLEEINKESNVILQGLGPTLQTAVDNLALYTGYTNLPELAVGTNYVPDNMVAKIHKGERVIPAADNAKLMAKLQQDEVLVKEVQQLNKQMAELTKVVAQGATINSDSTNQNTEEIVKAVDGLEKALVYFQKVQSKAMIV